MKKKSDKEKDLEALKKDFEAAQNIFVAGFEKLTVQQDFELRKTVRGAGGSYKVVKNNLAEKASQGTPDVVVYNASGRTRGPLVDLEGHVLGINIARAGRTESYAIPSEAVRPLLEKLKAPKKDKLP